MKNISLHDVESGFSVKTPPAAGSCFRFVLFFSLGNWSSWESVIFIFYIISPDLSLRMNPFKFQEVKYVLKHNGTSAPDDSQLMRETWLIYF